MMAVIFSSILPGCRSGKSATSNGLSNKVVVDEKMVQPPTSDTASMISKIVENKGKYIGQPFLVLSADLSLKIKASLMEVGNSRTHAYGLRISFLDGVTTINAYQNYDPSSPLRVLHIKWEELISRKDIEEKGVLNGDWTSSHQTFYNSRIIKDIE